jgi:sugar-specific transcriptional regulator TrmB
MAIFLNTQKIREWVYRLIRETETELIIIVPHLSASEKLLQYLKDADNRGVETTIIYRENKLSVAEKQKFNELDILSFVLWICMNFIKRITGKWVY